MTAILTPDIIALLDDETTIKILATVSADGAPHATEQPSLHHSGGAIHYLELLETSETNRNLVHNIWFGGAVAIALIGSNGCRFQIKGRPVKLHITGTLFLSHYERLRETHPDTGLAGVWVIEADEIIDEDFALKKTREEALHPDFVHLDRIAL